MIGIYCILNKVNNKKYYGSSKDILNRFKRHKRDLMNGVHHNIHLQRSWDKYGEESFEFNIILGCSEDELLLIEQEYLDDNNDGFNIGLMASGGDNITNNPNRESIIENIRESIINRYSTMSDDERKSVYGKSGKLNPNYGNKWSDEQKKKASKRVKEWMTKEENLQKLRKPKSDTSKMGKYDKAGPNNPFYGKTHTKDTINKIKTHIKEHRGEDWLPGNARKIEINGVTYNTLKEASKSVNLSQPTVIKRLKSDDEKWVNWFYL